MMLACLMKCPTENFPHTKRFKSEVNTEETTDIFINRKIKNIDNRKYLCENSERYKP